MGILVDLSGLKFNRLTVIGRLPNIGCKALWECVCECGNKTKCLTSQLKSGNKKSCGCYRREVLLQLSTSHGMATVGNVAVEYRAWLSIKERCYNNKSKSYKDYGGRGIGMFDEWVNDFDSFLSYIGMRPSKNHSVDRFPNNNGHYEPGNVRWATPKEQAGNTRKSVILTHNGVSKNLSDWAKYFNVKHEAIRYHLKNGRTITQIFNYYSLKMKGTKIRTLWKSVSG